MAFSGSSFRHQRKARSASVSQKEWSRVLPWSNHFWASGFFVVMGRWVRPMPSITQGFVRGPVS
jgi:hypothetical protein